MTDDGLTWKEQADALANYVLANQSIEGLTIDENGKTDVVAGVSISIAIYRPSREGTYNGCKW